MGNDESKPERNIKDRSKRSKQSSKVGNYKPPRLGPQVKTEAQKRAIDRYSSDSKKPRKPKGSLQRKEQILAVLDDADNLKDKRKKTYYDEISGKSFHSLTAKHEYRFKEFGIPIPQHSESATLSRDGSPANKSNRFKYSAVSSSTNQGKAAISRMHTGEKPKRRMKTADMVLAEGLSAGIETPLKNTGASGRRKKKNTEDRFVARGDASEAARFRMAGVNKKKTILNSGSRAYDLLHGDALKQDNQRSYIASDGTEFASVTSKERYEDSLKRKGDLPTADTIKQNFSDLVSNSDTKVVKLTAKTMLKITSNLLQADTFEAKEKFGHLRLSNKAIIKRFVEVPYALRLLKLVGFRKVSEDNEDIMVFNFCKQNLEYLEYLRRCLQNYQTAIVDEVSPTTHE